MHSPRFGNKEERPNSRQSRECYEEDECSVAARARYERWSDQPLRPLIVSRHIPAPTVLTTMKLLNQFEQTDKATPLARRLEE
jgi:hypothetical protein